jgi:membrane associated rhomboid family serine protease
MTFLTEMFYNVTVDFLAGVSIRFTLKIHLADVMSVGQSPLFYTFDTPWFLIPHSFIHFQCSHFSRDMINATSVKTL